MKTRKHLKISAALVVLGVCVVQKAAPDSHAFGAVGKDADFTKLSTDIHGQGCACAHCCGVQQRFAPRQ